MLDTVIRNSVLYGLEGGKSAKADIGIKNGRIASIGKVEEETAEIVDGEGLYTLPGFVDVHSHSDYYLLIDSSAEGKVRQGITTDIGGNCGYSAAPIDGEILKIRGEAYREQFGLELNWHSFSDYWKKLETGGTAINFAGLIGYNTLRASIVGLEDIRVDDSNKRKMLDTIRANLEQGALGMSIGLVYPPACFADRDEVAEMVDVVRQAGKIFTTHIRSEGKTLVESIEEVIDIARKTGVKLHISHLKTAGRENWNKLEKVFELIEQAQQDGIEIRCDRYPYTASNTGLQVLLPDWAFDGGRDAIMERLNKPETREKMREEILRNHPEPEYWDSVMVSQVMTEKNSNIQGLTVAEGAAARGDDPIDFVFDLLAEEKTEVEAIYFCMSEENMDRVLAKDYVMVGSDAGARSINGPLGIGRPHPRTFGTFPRFFREHVFTKKLFSMEEAVRKTSTAACEWFGLEKRGSLIEGYHADIVMIDPETIKDIADYRNPLAYPEGIINVWVNGKATIRNGEFTGITAGAPLKTG